MTRILRAEWTKLRTMPSTPWLFAGIVLVMIAVGAAVTATTNVKHCPTPSTCFEDLPKLALSGAIVSQLVVLALAVLTIGNEYGTRMIQTSLLAVPRRWQVLTAKLIMVTALTLVAGAIGVLGSLAVGRGILAGNGFDADNGYPSLSLSDGPTLRAATGTVLYLCLIAALSLGIATVVRDTAAGLTTVVTLLVLSPMMLTLVNNPVWHQRLARYSPMNAGLAIQATLRLDTMPIGPWAGLGVLACYATAALFVGVVTLRQRDA